MSCDKVNSMMKNLSCEQKCGAILAAVNVGYFIIVYLMDYNLLSFAFSKAMIFLSVGIIKTSFLGLPQKE